MTGRLLAVSFSLKIRQGLWLERLDGIGQDRMGATLTRKKLVLFLFLVVGVNFYVQQAPFKNLFLPEETNNCLPAVFLILHFSPTGVTSPALNCETPPIKAPCNAKGMSSCDWILLNSVNKVFCEEHKSSRIQTKFLKCHLFSQYILVVASTFYIVLSFKRSIPSLNTIFFCGLSNFCFSAIGHITIWHTPRFTCSCRTNWTQLAYHSSHCPLDYGWMQPDALELLRKKIIINLTWVSKSNWLAIVTLHGWLHLRHFLIESETEVKPKPITC